jgi:hypothetical protein
MQKFQLKKTKHWRESTTAAMMLFMGVKTSNAVLGLPFALGVLPDPDLSDEHTDLHNIPDVSFRRFFP